MVFIAGVNSLFPPVIPETVRQKNAKEPTSLNESTLFLWRSADLLVKIFVEKEPMAGKVVSSKPLSAMAGVAAKHILQCPKELRRTAY